MKPALSFNFKFRERIETSNSFEDILRIVIAFETKKVLEKFLIIHSLESEFKTGSHGNFNK